MRICRYSHKNEVGLGFYFDGCIVPFGKSIPAASVIDVLPHGGHYGTALTTWESLEHDGVDASKETIDTADVQLLAPVQHPGKILLLAGNYADHIQEEGKVALERAETFPYLFIKPGTCINDPDAPVIIPRVNPDYVDYEAELGVIIGKKGKHIAEADALDYVAGYTVINDISDRKYKPNPDRKDRERDVFFDWQHGKWHDGFCPMGPCAVAATHFGDPGNHRVQLRVNGELRQSALTGQTIFSIGTIIEFITRTMTLEPGDIIATGTPSGVGMARGCYLRPGDQLTAAIDGIGILKNQMAAEK